MKSDSAASVHSLAEYRDKKRFESARLALLRARAVHEPVRTMQARAEEFCSTHWLGACNAFRSYAHE